MNQEAKTKWLDALRSGEYQQTTGALRRMVFVGEDSPATPAYCCLGVLCDITDGVAWTDWDDAVYGNSENAGVLPRDLRAALDISEAAMDILVRLNDRGRSFKTIANWIEEKL